MLRYLTLQIILISHLEVNVVSSTNIKTLANHYLPKHLKSQHQDMFCQVAGDLIVPLRQVQDWSKYLLGKLWEFHQRGK